MKRVAKSFVLLLAFLSVVVPGKSFGEYFPPPVAGVSVGVGVSVVQPVLPPPALIGSHGYVNAYGGGYGYRYAYGARVRAGCRCHCHGFFGRRCRRCCHRGRFHAFSLNIGFGGFGGGFQFGLGIQSF